ncbi:MAG TPA: carboxy terminal-processing peptidase [Gammaproteobacteria bacterium]|jgi:carboxyl-terminal processing protease
MKKKLVLISALGWMLLAAFLSTASATLTKPPSALQPKAGESSVDQAVAYVLTHYHYSHAPLNEALASKIFDEYLKELDQGHTYFLQSDIDSFGPYETTLGQSIQDGNLKPAFAIYGVFRQRFDTRMAYAMSQLDQQPDLQKDESLSIDDKPAAWSNDSAALDDIWRKRIKNDVIELMLDGKTWPQAQTQLKKRYSNLQQNVDKFDSGDVFSSFMNAYARALDPHTEYFPPVEYDQFKTQMSLKLEGIGVQLEQDDDYVKIVQVLPGSPASKSGLLHAGDRIASVGQGEDGDFVDVVGWRLDDVVRLTRGPKGTVLRLKILPAGAKPGAPPKGIRLVRDAIKLADQAARADVLEVPRQKGKARIGVIRVPEFYIDFDARQAGNPDYNSLSRDVRRLIGELQAKHIDGLVLDLRNNGGGSVDEAANLAGLFIPHGPVVQLRNSENRITVVRSTTSPVYSGPLAVLVDRLSASASEIFAGAIQDYKRGVIVGNGTYGKGVATQFADLSQMTDDQADAGQLMFVSDKFYRITGASTQDKGVSPDIQLPSLIDPKQFGEETEDHPLPWDTIAAVPYKPVDYGLDAMLAELRKRHEQRTGSDPLFQLYLGDIAHVKEQDAATSLSLVLDTRRRTEKQEEAWRASDDQTWKKLTGGTPADSAGDSGPVASPQDVALREGAAIVADMHELAPSGHG